MAATVPQAIQLTCPNCRSPMRAQIFTLIDVGRYPELKNLLLAGQLNLAICQRCGAPAMIAAPLIYHDPAKQLCLVHFPQQLNARPEEQERFIGEATSALLRDLPANAPRAYLLAPRRFLTLNSLVDAVLEADGISREVVEAQRQRVEVIGRLAEAYEQGEEQLANAVDQYKDALDYEFFATLSAFVEASARADRDGSSQMLLGLRDKLIELTGFNAEEMPASAEDDGDLDEVLDRLQNASDDDLEQTIAELRPMIDYGFFAAWTARIEAAEQAGDQTTAAQMTARRSLILETVERMDRQAQELFEAGAHVLRDIMAAEDPAAALRARNDQIDDAFMLVLEANLGAAERAGKHDVVARLTNIRELAIAIAEESLSPEDRFINELLNAETPQAATRLLRQNPTMITGAFVKRLNELADQFEQDGRKPISERLRQLGREAGAMLF